jgi:hypothetical protein
MVGFIRQSIKLGCRALLAQQPNLELSLSATCSTFHVELKSNNDAIPNQVVGLAFVDDAKVFAIDGEL